MATELSFFSANTGAVMAAARSKKQHVLIPNQIELRIIIFFGGFQFVKARAFTPPLPCYRHLTGHLPPNFHRDGDSPRTAKGLSPQRRRERSVRPSSRRGPQPNRPRARPDFAKLRRGQPRARARQSVATAASCSCSKRGGINWSGFVCPLGSACFVSRRSCGDALRATSPRPAMGRASLPASQLSSRLTVAQRERLD